MFDFIFDFLTSTDGIFTLTLLVAPIFVYHFTLRIFHVILLTLQRRGLEDFRDGRALMPFLVLIIFISYIGAWFLSQLYWSLPYSVEFEGEPRGSIIWLYFWWWIGCGLGYFFGFFAIFLGDYNRF